MFRPRIIPCLLLDGERLVKTTGFNAPSYVGDPINALKIFNEKEVDEVIVLDISASKKGSKPNFDYIHKLAEECFMPMCYGGGISSMDDAEKLISYGVEKIAINQSALKNLELLTLIAQRYGSQSVLGVMDVKKCWFRGVRVWNHVTRKHATYTPAMWALKMTEAGAGEILLNYVDRDGTQQGFDIELIQSVSRVVDVPVVACGGASSIENCKSAIVKGGAAAAAAGALFVYKGPHRAVLINYPDSHTLKSLFKDY
jgi:imidazole glycerol-phosphate synthase subunit HisF